MPSLATTEPCSWDSVRDPQFQSIDCWIFYSHNFHRSKLGMPMPAYSTQNDPKSTWVCPKKNCVCTKKKVSVVSPTAATFHFYKICLKRAAKPSAENTSAEPSLEPSREPCWTWPGSAPTPPRPSPEPSPKPVEPDLALHQGFLEPSPETSPEPCWTWPH
jgi:hypothetical protein